MKTDLSKIRLGHSPLSDKIYLYRHGKDPALALDKRDAMADVMQVLVQFMHHNMPPGKHATEFTFKLAGKDYELVLRAIEAGRDKP